MDLAYRAILAVLFIFFYLLLTPLDKIFSWKPFGSAEEESSKEKSPVSKNKSTEKKG